MINEVLGAKVTLPKIKNEKWKKEEKVSKYNPKQAYYDRKNKTQKKGDDARAKHKDSSTQGGCQCNYIISTDNKKGKW